MKITPEKERKYLFLCDRKSCHKCIMSEDSSFKGAEWCKAAYTDNIECAKNFRAVKMRGDDSEEIVYVEKYQLNDDTDNSNERYSNILISAIALIIAIISIFIRII